MSNPIQLTILLGKTHRADVAIEDFWQRAQSAVAGSGVPLQCLAIQAVAVSGSEELAHDNVKIVQLAVSVGGRSLRLANRWAAKSGPMGVAGRLAQYNLASRSVARALAGDRELTKSICGSDVIVAADPEADRAVWKLRKRTSAQLMHGPFAMANALTTIARKVGSG